MKVVEIQSQKSGKNKALDNKISLESYTDSIPLKANIDSTMFSRHQKTVLIVPPNALFAFGNGTTFFYTFLHKIWYNLYIIRQRRQVKNPLVLYKMYNFRGYEKCILNTTACIWHHHPYTSCQLTEKLYKKPTLCASIRETGQAGYRGILHQFGEN